MQIIHDLSVIQSKHSVITFGNFDGVHLGYQKIFSAINNIAKKDNIQSIVMTFKNHTIYPLKHNFLITNVNEKINLIQKSHINILYLLNFDENFKKITASHFLSLLTNSLKSQYIVVGTRCRFGQGAEGNVIFLKKNEQIFNYQTIVVSDDNHAKYRHSSSKIRKLIGEGNIYCANILLNQKYKIYGEIIKNSGKGSKLFNYPTINIKIPNKMLSPRFGVYSANVMIRGTLYAGIMNIGKRPTMNHGDDIMVEMYIFDFNKNIYRENVVIYPDKFIRDERKFNNIKELQSQIHDDVKIVKALQLM